MPIFSPVDDDGKFTEEAGRFGGLDVLGDGNTAVIEYLDECQSMIMVERYSELYSCFDNLDLANLFNFLNYIFLHIILEMIVQNTSIHMTGGPKSLQYSGQLSNGLPLWKDSVRLQWMQSAK